MSVQINMFSYITVSYATYSDTRLWSAWWLERLTEPDLNNHKPFYTCLHCFIQPLLISCTCLFIALSIASVVNLHLLRAINDDLLWWCCRQVGGEGQEPLCVFKSRDEKKRSAMMEFEKEIRVIILTLFSHQSLLF